MTVFAKYDETGRVLFHGDVPESMLALQGERIFAGEIDGHTHYVVDGAARLRPKSRAVRVGDNLMNLPIPCTILINGRAYECKDGVAALTFTYPGTYRVIVQAFPFLDAEFEITT